MNFPKYWISAHQTHLRTATPDKEINIATFDNLDLRKYYVEIGGQRHPRVGILVDYDKNVYIQQ